jgi:RNA polymerase sigma-70 factor (ECF subfamily)
MSRRPEVALVQTEIAEVNGQPAALLRFDGAVAGVLAPELDGFQISGVRLILNPAKLAFIATQLG